MQVFGIHAQMYTDTHTNAHTHKHTQTTYLQDISYIYPLVVVSDLQVQKSLVGLE